MTHLRLVLILGALTAFGPLSIDMYLSSFPRIAEAFAVPLADVELSLASFFVGLSLGQLLYGKVTDRFGRKRPLYFGLALYASASLGCMLAPNVGILIALRFLQALGACAGMVITRATIRDLFNHQEAARVFSLLMLVMGVTPILAPLVGSAIAGTLGWRAIFGLMVAAGLTCLVLVARLLPETRAPDPTVRFGDTFVTYWRIFRDRDFIGYAAAGGLAQAGMFAYITGSPFVFIDLFGIPADRFGWVFGMNALGLISMSQVNSYLLRTRTPDDILKFSFAGIGLMAAALISAGVLGLGLWAVLIPIFLYLSILGMTFPNTMAGALAKQGAHTGSASAVLGTIQFVLASISAGLVSHLHNGTAIPMTLTMGLCGAGSLALYRRLVRQRP